VLEDSPGRWFDTSSGDKDSLHVDVQKAGTAGHVRQAGGNSAAI
jgi:hypothetical protein